MTDTTAPPRGNGRGFAGMDEDYRRELAIKGGKSVPEEKRSFKRDKTLAMEAGRKGGLETQRRFRERKSGS